MSTVRRYLFAFFSTCVALAVGIALGGGPLQGTASADRPASSADTAGLRGRLVSLLRGQAFGTSLTQAASTDLLAKRLDGKSVTVVVLPGVSDDIVTGMRDALTQAGGVVSVTVRVAPRLVDPARKTFAASVADSSSQNLPDLSAIPQSDPYRQLGALIARAYAGRGEALVLDDEAIKIGSELEGAKLLTVDEQPHRRGALVVVLGTGDHASDDVTAAEHLIEVQLLSSLEEGADAVLAATPPTGTAPGGLLDAVHIAVPRPTALSTLNVTDGPAAQVAAVYALAAAAAGTTGDYGVEGTAVTLPPGLAVPGR